MIATSRSLSFKPSSRRQATTDIRWVAVDFEQRKETTDILKYFEEERSLQNSPRHRSTPGESSAFSFALSGEAPEEK